MEHKPSARVRNRHSRVLLQSVVMFNNLKNSHTSNLSSSSSSSSPSESPQQPKRPQLLHSSPHRSRPCPSPLLLPDSILEHTHIQTTLSLQSSPLALPYLSLAENIEMPLHIPHALSMQSLAILSAKIARIHRRTLYGYLLQCKMESDLAVKSVA